MTTKQKDLKAIAKVEKKAKEIQAIISGMSDDAVGNKWDGGGICGANGEAHWQEALTVLIENIKYAKKTLKEM